MFWKTIITLSSSLNSSVNFLENIIKRVVLMFSTYILVNFKHFIAIISTSFILILKREYIDI